MAKVGMLPNGMEKVCVLGGALFIQRQLMLSREKLPRFIIAELFTKINHCF